MNYLCDVIVLCWNRIDVTKQFVESFLANTFHPSRLIMIDNASTDGTREYLSRLQDQENCVFKVILNDENRGFIRGMNQGIAVSDAPYVCLANNDLIFTNGWLGEVISIFERYPNAGLLNPNSNNLGVHPVKGETIDALAKNLRSKHTGEFIQLPFCVGFCLITKREVINKVGGFSEEFYPMFFEDTDYSMKVREAGYLIGAAKSSYVYHLEHASMKQLGKQKEEIFLKSRETYEKKWGKMLRVGWVVNNHNELSDYLPSAVSLAGKGNFIHLFVKNKNVNRQDIFKKSNIIEHSGVSFISIWTVLDLAWKILKKKKKYDAIISDNKLTKCIFSKVGYNVLEKVNFAEIDKIRHNDI